MAFSTESTIQELLDNPTSRAFMEANMDELVNHPMLGMIKGMSLKSVAPFSGGKLTDELLAKIDLELKKLV